MARVKGEKGEVQQAFSTGLQNEISLATLRLYQDELNAELREFRPYGIGDGADRLSEFT